MVALRIETEPRAVATHATAKDVFRGLLREAVAQSDAAGPTRHIATNPEGVSALLQAIQDCRDLVVRGSDDDCRLTLVYLLARQERLVRECLFSSVTPECAEFNLQILDAMDEAGPFGEGEFLTVLRSIWEALASACEPRRCVVAGSVRRGILHPETIAPHDVDMVCVPKRETDLFGAPLQGYPELDAVIEQLIASGLLAWDAKLPKNGPSQKRFIIPALDDLVLDLYITWPERYGAILTIRTGPEDFCHGLVSRRCLGGLMPNHLRQVKGDLTKFDWKADRVIETLATPTEADYFAHLQLPRLPAYERNETGYRRLRDHADRGEWARKEAVR